MISRTNLQQLFLLALAGISLALCYVIVEPYIGPIVSATAMAILFYPVHAAMLRRMPGRESAAAAVSLLLVIALIVAPSIWITWTMSTELSAAYAALKSRSAADGGWIEWAIHTGSRPLIYFGIDPVTADEQVRDFLSERIAVISGTVLKLVQDVVSNIALFLFNAIIALFVLFFLLRDGDHILEKAREFLPLQHAVFDRLIGAGADVQTYHRTLYKVHQRVAQSFAQGRVILIGDAAHLNNPLGGFGMNSGVHDAFDLFGEIEPVINAGAGIERIARFERRRRTVTHTFTQAQTVANMEYIKVGSVEAHAQRRADMQAVNDDDDKRRAYLMRQAMFESLAHAATMN